MILQKDPRLKKEIQEFGCYYLTIYWFCNKFTNLAISTELINKKYEFHVYKEWIDENCKILDPQAIFRDLGVFVRYHDKHDPPDYICKDNEFEILHFKNNGMEHFTAGNGAGIVTYDPYGCSNTVRYGKLTSKRIFTLLNGQVC